MGKLIEQTHLKRRSTNSYLHEEMFNIVSHKGNENQNTIVILSQPNQNGYNQENNLQV
jgi:hypothetical protein